MDFALSDEQRMLVDMVRRFVEEELYPHEPVVEAEEAVPLELQRQIRQKAIDVGLYAANIPVELGGGGLDNVSLVLLEFELGRAAYALQYLVARPSSMAQVDGSGTSCRPSKSPVYPQLSTVSRCQSGSQVPSAAWPRPKISK